MLISRRLTIARAFRGYTGRARVYFAVMILAPAISSCHSHRRHDVGQRQETLARHIISRSSPVAAAYAFMLGQTSTRDVSTLAERRRKLAAGTSEAFTAGQPVRQRYGFFLYCFLRQFISGLVTDEWHVDTASSAIISLLATAYYHGHAAEGYRQMGLDWPLQC